MKYLAPLVGFLLALPHAGAQTSRPVDHLLAHVSDDAALVLVVPSLEKLTGGIAEFGRSIGVGGLADLKAEALLNRLDCLDRTDGLDTAGPFVVAQATNRPRPLILCQIKDPAAWRAATHAKLGHDGTLQVRVFGDTGVAAIEDGVLILGEDRETVQAARKADGRFAQRFASRAGALLSKYDVVAYADVPAWRPMIDTALSAAAMSMQVGMAMQPSPDEKMTALWRWMFEELHEFVEQIDAWAGGARASAAGIAYEDALLFRSGGPMAEYLKQVRPSRENLFRGLPAGAGPLVLGCEWIVPPGTKSLNARLFESMLNQDAIKAKLGNDAYARGLQASMAAYDLMSGSNMELTPVAGEAWMSMTGQYFTRDPANVVDKMCSAFEISPEFMKAFGGASTMEVTLRKERIESADVRSIDMTFKSNDQEMRRMLESMYGKTATLHLVPHRDAVVFTMGPTEQSTEQLRKILAGKAGKLTDDERVVAATKAISPDPQICVLLDVPRFMSLVVGAVRRSGAPIPAVDLGDTPRPYVAFGVYLQPDRIRMEAFVPAEPIKVFVQVVQKLQAAHETQPGQDKE